MRPFWRLPLLFINYSGGHPVWLSGSNRSPAEIDLSTSSIVLSLPLSLSLSLSGHVACAFLEEQDGGGPNAPYPSSQLSRCVGCMASGKSMVPMSTQRKSRTSLHISQHHSISCAQCLPQSSLTVTLNSNQSFPLLKLSASTLDHLSIA